ncbi:hypothetical protein F9L16_21365 [Agarivorans sp. B2Z047]|uniref:hypothetical protein n=1 Tax=Agarivorans sp. B2Z047 TaxID=2652721 RepID=UPI00128BA3F8|nr:hypothetical protein [Agarivorans sp. B2Z047]MPW31528.1 hypothetical protein [Agarivorans sp. B2Z047]UQN42571.1 hypothetical protein LQZ07_22795 [Agarivorans sp. B2Z047]
MQLLIQNYNWGPELEVVRKHKLLNAIRDFAVEKCADASELVDGVVTNENAKLLNDLQRFSIILDLSRGELYENCKTRNYIAYKTSTIYKNDRVTIQALKHEYRSYLNECVVLYERLAFFLAFLESIYKSSPIEFGREKEHIHTFFNPLVFDIRNENAHHRYVVRAEYLKVESLENEIHGLSYKGGPPSQLVSEYLDKFGDLIEKDLDWFEYSSKEFATFFTELFDEIAEKILKDGNILIPNKLPEDLDISKKISPQFRRKLKHTSIFNEHNQMNV